MPGKAGGSIFLETIGSMEPSELCNVMIEGIVGRKHGLNRQLSQSPTLVMVAG